MATLTALEELRLGGNQLRGLPDALEAMTKVLGDMSCCCVGTSQLYIR